ncbi:MAG: Wzz/FepE/Etk N-terminal domain-containing protein [Gammaproteobacteria bacterium]
MNPGAGSPPWPPNYPASDEIDLVDLGVLLWRRRWLMLVVFLVFLALTIVGTIIKNPTYEYTTGIELGSRLVSTTGNVAPLMSAPTVAEAMRNLYIPQAIAQYLSQQHVANPASMNIPKFTVSGQPDAGAVVLNCKAKQSRAQLCTAVQLIAADNFVSSNTQFATGAKNQLAALQAQATVLHVQMDKLDASAALYQKQAASLEQQIGEMHKAGVQAARGANNGSAALSNLILNTEVQRASDTLNTVRQQLDVTIPQQRAQLTQQLSDNANAQQLQEQNISQGFARMVNPGLRSIEPVGLKRGAVFGIGLIVSIILAILAAFIANYVESVRLRLRNPA